MSFDPDLDAPMLVIYLGSSVANSVRLLLRFRDSGKRGAFFSFLSLPFFVSKIGTKKCETIFHVCPSGISATPGDPSPKRMYFCDILRSRRRQRGSLEKFPIPK